MASRRTVGRAELDALGEAARELFGAEPVVVAAYLFGSAARGEAARDVDVGVVTRCPVPSRTLERWASELQARGAPHGPEIDLRPLASTPPRFRVTVLREGRLLYEGDRRARLEFEARSTSEWADFRPTWLRMRRRMLERWQHG